MQIVIHSLLGGIKNLILGEKMKKTVIFCLIILSFQLGAQQVGTIAVLRGNVSVQRNGRDLGARELDLGTTIENLDFIKTSRNSILEIAMDPRSGFNGRLIIRENTTIQLELSRLRTNQRGNIELIAGSVGVSVNRLAGGSSLNVRTQTANMGVRGTTFDVSTAPEGSILVTTSEGRVACENEQGDVVYSEPGSAVESGEGTLRVIPVAVSSLEQFRREWNAQKIEAFRPNAPRAARQFVQQYQRLLREFNQGYSRLESQNAIIDKWINEHRQGQTGARQESLREKRAIIGPLMNLRRNLFLFERIYYRLVEIRDYLDNAALNSSLGSGQTLRSFYAQLDNEGPGLRQKMGRIRFVAKLYALRNDGELPIPGFGEDEGGESDNFFD